MMHIASSELIYIMKLFVSHNQQVVNVTDTWTEQGENQEISKTSAIW